MVREIIHPQGTIYYQGTFSDQRHDWNIVVAEIGMGSSGAALETERAIHFFRPEVIFFVGIASGLKDVQIGDVVAAMKVYNYESGKESASFQARPEVWRTSYALEQRARAEALSGVWLSRLNEDFPGPSPRVFIGALAAEDKIIASKRASVYQLLRTVYGDALAVEMEGHGFLQAVRANQSVQALVVRGISALIGDKTGAEQAYLRERAARHAAAFAFEVLARFIMPDPAHSDSENVPIPDSTALLSQISKDIVESKKAAPARRKVFITYNHKDARWLERLHVHLAPIEREGMIDLWDDTKIAIGTPWQAAIQEALETAKVAIALVSADFLASDFIIQYELPKLLSRAASSGLIIIPLIVSPCLFTRSWLSTFQAANDPNRPLSSMTVAEREKILMNLAKNIEKRLSEN